MPETRVSYIPEHASPPGATLQEVLEERGMSQSDLAIRTGLSAKHVNQIVKGTAPVTAETTLLLERATGVPAAVWANLESAFQVEKSREKEAAHLGHDLDWLGSLPVTELEKRGRIQRTGSPVETLRQVCNFFGVADRASWETLWHKPTAYRRSRAFESDPGAIAAWLRIGEIEATAIDCAPFNKARLRASLIELRRLTRVHDPKVWAPRMRELGQAVGVAIVLEPEIKGARIAGAARWLTPDKAMVQLSLRHRWSDIFWFTVFHELGHIVLHSKKDVFINDPGPHSGAELEADAFAAQFLIPRDNEARLGTLQSDDDVRTFADEIGIGPDIIVGRLQHEGRWAFSRGNSLKHRFIFTQER
jgi:HTH-type transcriptional regulator / antitoxin HigA